MPLEPGKMRTPAGIRSLLYVAASYPLSSYSLVSVRTNAIRNAAGAGGIGQTGFVHSTGSQSVSMWPFASAFMFDVRYNTGVPLASLYGLPCNQAKFQLGEDVYVPTDDGVPGTNRVRRRRARAYSYDVTFPIIVTASADGSKQRGVDAVYADVLTPFLRSSASMPGSTSIELQCMKMATSQQLDPMLENRMYPCVLETFTAEVSGAGAAQPISCSLRTRGILNYSILGQADEVSHYWPRSDGMTGDSGGGTLSNGVFMRDGRYIGSSVHGDDAEAFGGRLANIKDCTVYLGNVSYEDVVHIRLSIQQELDFVSKGGLKFADYLRYADWVHLNRRVVRGSFSYLSSSVIRGTPASPYPGGSSPVPQAIPAAGLVSAASANLDGWQFASPLMIDFAGLRFDMPATYWQPSVQELKTGHSLVTVSFLARGDVVGRGEVG